MNVLRSSLAAALAGAVLFGAQGLQAQSYLLPGTPEKGLWLEVSHPEVETFEVTVPSTAWYASGRYPVAQSLWAVAEIPFAYGKVDGPAIPELEGGTVLGNPYLGLEYAASDRVRVEAGARLPLTTADDFSFGDVVGFLADPLRGEAFMQDVVPLSAAVTFSHSLTSGMKLQARSGVTSMIWRGDDELGETMTALDYGLLGQYPMGLARFGGGLTGRWDVSAEEDGFSENSLHQLGLSADYQFGRLRPGLNLRIPLDEEYRDLVTASMGVYLQVSLP